MAASTASKQADGAHRGFFCGHHAALPPHFCASPAHALRETSHAGCSCGPTMTSHACARAWAAPARAWASADWDCPPPEEYHAQDTIRGRSLHAPWQNPCLRMHDRGHLDWTDERSGRFGPEGQKNTLWRKWLRPIQNGPAAFGAGTRTHVVCNLPKYEEACCKNARSTLDTMLAFQSCNSFCFVLHAPLCSWRRGQRPNWVQARPHCSAYSDE